MNGSLKNILNKAGLYHPLQSFYRHILAVYKNKKYRYQHRSFAGSGFTCNVCNSQYRRFVPDYPSEENKEAIQKNDVIGGYGENVFCPNCMSTARERLVIAMLQNLIRQEHKILHLSPEKNIYHFLKDKAQVITADLFPGFYKAVDRSIQQQDATRLNFDNNSFDMVIANHIMEHIPDDEKAMSEIFRVMKPGAVAVLQVPYSDTLAATIENKNINDPLLQSALYGQKDHVRIYKLEDYMQRLKKAGFVVEAIEESPALSKYAVQPREKFLKIHKP